MIELVFPMKMKKFLPTTPFEDLILGSQFVPLLAKTQSKSEKSGAKDAQKYFGVFQCKKCKTTLVQVKEALSHYKSHVLETHKEYFSVVFGGLCSKKGCVYVQRSDPSIHFHCSHCRFTACEILELPLHMEEQHLSFYKEVSLALSKEDAQLNKVYKCGECDLSLQGKVSIVQHLLTHENNSSVPTSPSSMEMTNGNVASLEISNSQMNGLVDCNGGQCERKGGILLANNNIVDNSESKALEKSKHEPQEQIQVEINPLDLLSTLIEEDLKSDNPLLPTQHFLLGHSKSVDEENYSFYEEDSQGGYASGDSLPPPEEESEPLPQINGFPLSAESFYDNSPAPGVFQCNQCNEAFKYQYLLTAHKKQSHQGNILTPFKCHICGNEFTALSDLKRHFGANHSPEFGHFCQICGHAFVDSLNLKQHLVDHGKSTKKTNPMPPKDSFPISSLEKTVCDGCSVEFSSKADLTRHIVKYQGTCNPNKNDALRCATCGEEMSNLEALKEHRRVSHPSWPAGDPSRLGGKKGFQCDYCGKNFSCRSNLRDHLVVHTGEKPYPCDVCGKAFSFIHNMKTHRLTHNEGRNEMCPYCDKAYKSKISLYYHMKKGNCRGLSTKEVPEGFSRCTECLQMFASEERFQNHKAKGNCQMSYRCIHCGIRCSSQEKLDKHIQKGVCTKESGDGHAADKKRRHRKKEHRSEEPVCCERCNNYNRDCCCTFSCRFCNKRVFSIGAYITHQRFHITGAAPPTPGSRKVSTGNPSRQRRERIRVAIMEKRKRKRKRKGVKKPPKKGAAKAQQVTTIPPPLDEKKNESGVVVSSEAPPEESKAVSIHPEDSLAFSDIPLTGSLIQGTKEGGNSTSQSLFEDNDSNSGSLTDLSTFTAPNLLKPVHSSAAPSIGCGGED